MSGTCHLPHTGWLKEDSIFLSLYLLRVIEDWSIFLFGIQDFYYIQASKSIDITFVEGLPNELPALAVHFVKISLLC